MFLCLAQNTAWIDFRDIGEESRSVWGTSGIVNSLALSRFTRCRLRCLSPAIKELQQFGIMGHISGIMAFSLPLEHRVWTEFHLKMVYTYITHRTFISFSQEQHTKTLLQPELQEWMLMCQCNSDLQPNMNSNEDYNWASSSSAYPNLEELPSFIARQRQTATQRIFTTTANPQYLQGKQLQAYTLVQQHLQTEGSSPLHMIVSGTAGTGKSYLIHCLRLLLKDKLCVAAPTGVAAFNVDGHTLHSLLSLPTKGEFKDLEGEHLHRIQQSLANMEYLIIDKMSMVGRKTFGQVDKRLRQVFPHRSDQSAVWGLWPATPCDGSPPLHHNPTDSSL